MPRKMSRKSDRYLQPEGEMLVRVLRLVDIGTQDGYQGSQELQLRLTYECVEDVQTFKRKDGTEITGPSLLDSTYTQKLSSSAKFFKVCKAAVGSAAVDKEDFDPSDIVGKYLMLELEHKTSQQGNKYVKITDHFRAAKDDIEEVKDVKSDNDSFAWWLEEGTDWDVFDNFPEFIRDMISSCPEYEELNEEEEEEAPKTSRKSKKKEEEKEKEDDQDNLPFDKDGKDKNPPARKSRRAKSEDY